MSKVGYTLLIHTGWLDWEGWSRCSRSCNGGVRFRQRFCRSGQTCQGNQVESETCGLEACLSGKYSIFLACPKLLTIVENCLRLTYVDLKIDLMIIEFGDWADWSQCSVTCGSGSQSRNRQCMRGNCNNLGPSVMTRSCIIQDCPGNIKLN